ADALKAGTIAGAGVDVFTAEPVAADNPLVGAPNVVLTPHLGASTVEAQENVAVEAAQLLADFLLRGQVANAVNMATVNPAVLARGRGIEIGESHHPKKGDFAALLHTEVETEQGTTVAAGTLFGDLYVRLVQLGPFRMEGYLDGVLMVFTHRDVPVMIGFIG